MHLTSIRCLSIRLFVALLVLVPAAASAEEPKKAAPPSERPTVGDLVRHYPRRYVDRGKLTEIAGLELGEHVTVLAEVEKVSMRDMRHRRGKLMQVVITDGRMPGCSGLDIVRAMHGFDPRVPVVLVTAFGSAETHAAAKSLGAVAVLDKPFEVERLCSVVTDALRRCDAETASDERRS